MGKAADLARLYGVTTKRFNEAFKRNRERFPGDFAQLTASEFVAFRSALTSQTIEEEEDSSNWSQIAASSSAFMAAPMRHRSVKYRPWAFTEHGSLMAANILRSDQAMRMSVFAIRAFVRLREQATANAPNSQKACRDRQDTASARRRLARGLSQTKRRIGF